MSLDEPRLAEMMKKSVDGLHHPNRWSEVPGRAAALKRRRRARVAAAGGIAAAAAAIALIVGVAGTSHSNSRNVVVGHQPTVPSSQPAPNTSTPPSTSPSTSVAPSTPPVLPAGYLPLYPFTSAAEVVQWENSRRPYVDSGQTALAFAHFLGYTEVNQVIATRSAPDGDHVSVGYTIAGAPGTPAHAAAIIHLVRYGPGGPWEVVGTDDTTLTLTSPPYGSKAVAPLSIGGAITGVDESIDVKVFGHGSNTPLRDSCCHAAGGTDTPWSVLIPDPTQYRGILIIAASTGGHVAQVERFAVTGVRADG